MKLTFQLQSSDFLAYQLYATSQIKESRRKRQISRFIVPIIYIGFGIHFYVSKDQINGFAIFAFLGVAWYILYPRYSFWKYKKYIQKFIEQNYAERVNKDAVLEFNEDTIVVKDFTTDSVVNSSEVIALIELTDLYLVKLSTETSLIVPKSAVENEAEFKALIIKYNAVFVDETNWTWK